MPDPLIGRSLGGRYLVEKLLGVGGMGAVYEGTQLDIRRRVAIKVLRSAQATPEQRARFEREARALASINSPHVVVIRDFQAPEGEPPFLVMEFLEGRSLSAVVKEEGRLAPLRVARIATQVLAALAEAHRLKIVHRDVKPANIVLERSPALGEIAKLVDFGVSTADVTIVPQTLGTAFVGTLAYMAPEQAKGEAVDGRSDVYGVGAAMYYATTLRRPVEAESAAALVDRLLHARAAPVASHRPELDQTFAAIVDRALAPDPANRWPTAETMASALQAWIEAQADATRSSAAPMPKVAPPTARGGTGARVVAIGAVILALAALGALAAALVTTRSSSAPPLAVVDASTPEAAAAPVVVAVAAPSATSSTPPTTSGAPSASAAPLVTVAHGTTPAKVNGRGGEVRDEDDPSNTGIACTSSQSCPSGASCREGACRCHLDEMWCHGKCMARDIDNCGGCGRTCRADQVCARDGTMRTVCSTCAEVALRQGKPAMALQRCPGGLCIDVTSDIFNCGACGRACDPAKHETCSGGKCVALYQ